MATTTKQGTVTDGEPMKHISSSTPSDNDIVEVPINASGHHQELERNFGLWSIISLAITSGNTWITLGGSITVAIYNGGAPGIIYEFIAVSVCYWFIAASIAELASAMPSAGGVYHWASITAGKYGRGVGFFAGWWNFLAWIFGLASTLQILAAQTVSMYALTHPDFVEQRWHVFVSYIIATWVTCSIVLLANRALPIIEQLGGFFIIAGVLITIIVCAVMPASTGAGHATNSFVWKDWINQTGYTSNGFVFLAGMLNGAYAVGTPDIVSHLAEEIPNPSVNIPKAMLAQYVAGFFTALFYAISILYAITDLDSILESSFLFPLAAIYGQATGSSAGGVGLLVCVFLPTLASLFGIAITASRTFWTLARDNATPASGFFSKVNPTTKNPANSIILCGVICTILGCIYVGSTTAFSAFVGSFVILTCVSYIAAILPHVITKRARVIPGPFWMKGGIGFVVNVLSIGFMCMFIVVFCFPFALPTDAASMNYASLMTGGLTIFVAIFWLFKQKSYVGPRYVPVEADGMAHDI